MKTLARFFLTLICLTSLTLVGATAQPAAAQVDNQLNNQTDTSAVSNPRTLSAIPPREGDQEALRAEPGETIQTTIQVRNNSQEPITLRSFAQDFIVKEDGKTPIPVEDTVSNRWSLAKWMTVTPNQHTLKPNEKAEMAVVIEVPADALPGGHYAMVIHEPLGVTNVPVGEQSTSAVNQRVGTLFYVIVEGPINEEAYIREFEFKKFQEFGPVPFSYLIRNQSDIHIRPSMNIDIFNLLGQKVDSIKVEGNNIFPLNAREFAGKWDRVWGFGLYTAKLTAAYGSTGQVAIANTNFWIIPVRIILAILFTILLLIAIVIAVKRYTENKMRQEQQKLAEMQQKLEAYEQGQQQDQSQAEPADKDTNQDEE
jgi:hypothetical protein